MLLAAGILVSGLGCQCVGPRRIRQEDVAVLSTCPRPSRVEAAGETRKAVPVAWVGRFQRLGREGEFTYLEYKFAVVRNFPVVLRALQRGKPTFVDPRNVEDSEETFEVRIPNSDNPERWPEVASPCPVALWTGIAERWRDRVVLHARDRACEIRIEPASR